jgi:hypothetical protein
VPIFRINFYSIHARDLLHKEGFGRGGIKYCCFLPLEESVCKFDLRWRGLRMNNEGYSWNRGISTLILEGVFRAWCVPALCLDDVEKFVVSNVARLEEYSLIVKWQINHLLRHLRLFVLFFRDVFLFPRSRNEILNITTYAALFTRHFTAAGSILRFVSIWYLEWSINWSQFESSLIKYRTVTWDDALLHARTHALLKRILWENLHSGGKFCDGEVGNNYANTIVCSSLL